MYRYTLTVPVNDNDGSSLAILHKGIARRLARDYHGFTTLQGPGAWHDPELARNVGREDVILYIIDTDNTLALEDLTNLARAIRRAAAQDAVYLTRQPIETWLVV